jgi:hypothetical protein
MVKRSDEKNRPVVNIVSIVLGSISIIISFIFPYFVAITGTLGVILAYVEKEKGSKKLNSWALILNIIGIFLAILILSIALVALVWNNNLLNGLGNLG